MKKLKFIFGIHCHQPVGNLDFVIKNAHDRSYRPFIEFLLANPGFKCVLHYSGILLEWFEKNDYEILSGIYELISRNQVELLSGGFYEPIMSDIMMEDKVAQVRQLSEMLNRLFGIIPQGIWLAERVWEENYPTFISQTGLKYTILDDFHFKAAGFSQDSVNGYYITEDINNPLFVFPINMKLRYLIPFGNIEEIIIYLEKIYEQYENPVIVFMDDGEKFGEWPGTYDTVYRNRWLEELLARLEEKSDLFELTTFSETLATHKPTGRAYIPANSYRELIEWSQPANKYESYLKLKNDLGKIGIFTEMENFFIPDGYWKNFFVKYPESNLMHKRMIYERRRLNALREIVYHSGSQGYDSLLNKSLEYLHKSQCSCAYWHGKFGGIYYPHLRKEVYRNIIRASKINDRIEHGEFDFMDVYETDFDCDGMVEVFINTKKQNLVFKPETGGRLVIWELKEIDFNILNSISRKREAYHNEIFAKYQDISSQVFFDWHLKDSFLDHFFHSSTSIDDFYRSRFGEQGDFVLETYSSKSYITKNYLEHSMHRDGHVWVDHSRVSVSVEKKFLFIRKEEFPTMKCKYYLTNNDSSDRDFCFGSEINLFFDCMPFVDCDGQIRDVHYSFETAAFSEMSIYGEDTEFELRIEQDGTLYCWVLPLYTFICSRNGYEKILQGITLVMKKNLKIRSKETCQLTFDIMIQKKRKSGE